jgi:hypothetical protein
MPQALSFTGLPRLPDISHPAGAIPTAAGKATWWAKIDKHRCNALLQHELLVFGRSEDRCKHSLRMC